MEPAARDLIRRYRAAAAPPEGAREQLWSRVVRTRRRRTAVAMIGPVVAAAGVALVLGVSARVVFERTRSPELVQSVDKATVRSEHSVPSSRSGRAASGEEHGIQEELEALDSVRRDWERGEVLSARGGLERYRVRFPSGSLGLEADALEVLVGCALEPGATAWNRARRFLTTHGESPYVAKVEEKCFDKRREGAEPGKDGHEP